MKKPIVNTALFVIAILGVLLIAMETNRHWELKAEHQKWVDQVGEFSIVDPNKLQFLALPTDDPLHFRWRVYLPTGYTVKWTDNFPGFPRISSGTILPTSRPQESILQIRFRQDKEGMLWLYHQNGGISNTTPVKNRELGQFITEHWNELEIIQVSSGELQTFRHDEEITILKIVVPTDLLSAAKEQLPKLVNNKQRVLYEKKWTPDSVVSPNPGPIVTP